MDGRADHQQIEINTFGGFAIKNGEKTLEGDAGRTRQVWTLLEYLIVNRHVAVSQEKLAEILWEEDASKDPTNALKNLIYRLRRLLDSLRTSHTEDFIVFQRNTYAWNNALPCRVDAEEFDTLCQEADTAADDERKLRLYRRAIDLYRGEYLPKSSMEEWVVVKATYYRNLFVECVRKHCGLLQAAGKTGEAVRLCEKAVAVEPFEEALHEMLIGLYISFDSRQNALVHYRCFSEFLYKKLDVKLSESLREFSAKRMEKLEKTQTNLRTISMDLREKGRNRTVYQCDYDVFRDICQIMTRAAERLGQQVFIVLLTLKTPKDAQPVVDMQILREVIVHSLRKSDVLSRCNNTQYVLMLPVLSRENAQQVVLRILAGFERENHTGTHLDAQLHLFGALD